LHAPLTLTTGFDRPNLFFAVRAPQDKRLALLQELDKQHDRSGIIYCSTRKNTETVCTMLQEAGYDATMYHAGLDPAVRAANQEDFLYDRKPIMVATNAFGMGIDKSNVSFVIHYNIPKSVEAYYQEAGRAGRDGEPADCVLLYSSQDVMTQQFLIEHSEPNPDRTEAEQAQAKRLDYARLAQMKGYAMTSGCLRAYILRYFGETPRPHCDYCSNCLENSDFVNIFSLRIPKGTVRRESVSSAIHWKKPRRLTMEDLKTFQTGTHVIHNTYGAGRILVCAKDRVVVRFDSGQKRELLFPECVERGFLTLE
jgi:ATP-dependent DNA helicase RecQ